MTIAETKKWEEILASTVSEKFPEGNEDAAGKAWMRWKCLTDLYFLGSVIFGLEKAVGSNNRHRLDPALHRQLANLLQSDEDQLIIFPRLHMKTTWLKFAIVQLILQNPMRRIGLWSRTATLVS